MKRIFNWVEIPAENFKRATSFYTSVFGWELQIIESEKEKMACLPNGEGAISWAANFNASKDGVLVNISVKDIDETLSKIEEHAGRCVQSKTEIEAEGMGSFALFLDSEGNRLGLHQAS